MRALDLDQITAIIAGATKPINVLWQTDDSIAFVARGREGRSEFHVDPSGEVMYVIRGAKGTASTLRAPRLSQVMSGCALTALPVGV